MPFVPKTVMDRCCELAAIVFLSFAFSSQAIAQTKVDLTDASLESLLNLEVTSASRKEQKISETTSAVYVITQEDIARSGFTSVPEVLRLAPGLSVARISGNTWAITARGFTDRFSNKLLVMIDGRPVYSPVFSGVYWDIQDLPLEDVERIEVIRGPGATMWGANAVNGVINVITKDSASTKGALLSTVAGTEDRSLDTARYGAALGVSGSYRIYSRYTDRAPLFNSDGSRGVDSSSFLSGGFRTDWKAGKDSVTVSAETYGGTFDGFQSGFATTPPYNFVYSARTPVSGGNAVAHWERAFSKTSGLAVQTYFTADNRNDTRVNVHERSMGIDLQYHFALGHRQSAMWGAAYHRMGDDAQGTNLVSFDPERWHGSLYNAFFQDDIQLANSVRITAGIKAEYQTFGGFAPEPNLRLLWKLSTRSSMWAAASRAVRTPSRQDQDIVASLAAVPANDGSVSVVTLFGGPNGISETLAGYETGYRYQQSNRFSLDLTGFYNRYHNLRTEEPGQPYPSGSTPSYTVIRLTFANKMAGVSFGGEASATLRLTSLWKLTGAYTQLWMNLHPYSTSLDTTSASDVGDVPHHQFQVHSAIDLPHRWQFNSAMYFTGRLADLAVARYTRVDANLSRQFGESLSIGVFLQNALKERRAEYANDNGTIASETPRSVYLKLTWRY